MLEETKRITWGRWQYEYQEYQAENEQKSKSVKVLLAKSNSFQKFVKEKREKLEEYTVHFKELSIRKKNW